MGNDGNGWANDMWYHDEEVNRSVVGIVQKATDDTPRELPSADREFEPPP